ncbi:MAG: 50S ribosomal protein L11 [Candidatus Odinarchaeia archaeon]
MGTVTINAMVEGGKASAGPPIGPALGPTGVNVFQVITEINKKTQAFEGLKVPVRIEVNDETKTFEIEVGIPPASALLLKELGVEKGSSKPNTDKIGDLSLEKVISIAKGKKDSLFVNSDKAAVKTILGTCVSMGITVDGKDPREVQEQIDKGELADLLQE